RRIKEAFTYMIDFVTRRIVSPIQLPMSLPLPEHRRFAEAKRSVNVLIDRVIEQYQNRPEESMLLSILMHAHDEETGIRVTDVELHDETLNMFFAGYETSAQAM